MFLVLLDLSALLYHICYVLLVGNDYKYLLPLSCLGGGILLVFADAIARSWFDPIELPVGILLSFLGGPFFLYLIHRGGKQRDFR